MPLAMGALTSNEVYLSSFPDSERGSIAAGLLPDLATQVQAFIASSTAAPGETAPGSALFVISYGFWDIYHLAGLEYTQAQKLADDAVDALMAQLGILYAHHSRDAIARAAAENSTSVAPFRAVVPKLLDPSLVPGWLSRAVPPAPSSVAEHQKQAVYLTDRWNARLENALGTWAAEGDVHKHVFCYDLAQHVVDLLVEHQLEDAGLSDAAGLGKGESPFESVAEPCVRDGKTVCAEPEQYLFWDDFTLGSVANEGIGKAAAGLVRQKGILSSA
jgi:phospholipase/lecithinase/hemolysin